MSAASAAVRGKEREKVLMKEWEEGEKAGAGGECAVGWEEDTVCSSDWEQRASWKSEQRSDHRFECPRLGMWLSCYMNCLAYVRTLAPSPLLYKLSVVDDMFVISGRGDWRIRGSRSSWVWSYIIPKADQSS